MTCASLLSDVFDDGLHHVLPTVGLHRVDVLNDLAGESQTAVDHPCSLHPASEFVKHTKDIIAINYPKCRFKRGGGVLYTKLISNWKWGSQLWNMHQK